MMNKIYDFISVDFENADNDQYACQVGIVAVKNKEIVKEISYLIQPPENRYGKMQSSIHGITAEKTKNSPTFNLVWDEIREYFEGQVLVCHQAPTDIAILQKSLAYYGIDLPDFNYIDTCDVIEKCRLDELCAAFDIDFTNHHNALEDARVTAQIWLKFNTGVKPDLSKIDMSSRKKGMDKFFGHKKLDSDLFVKDLTNADPNNPFYDKKVVITGDFSFIDRKGLAAKLKRMGADIDSGISRKTNIVLTGDKAGPSKMKKLEQLLSDGCEIRQINENELINLINN